MADHAVYKKLLPSELGCDRPYAITYSGTITFQDAEGRQTVIHYIEAWKETARRLIVLLQQLLDSQSEAILPYLMVSPKLQPEWVRQHHLLTALDSTAGGNGKWAALSDKCLYQLLRSFVAERRHRAAVPFRAVLRGACFSSLIITPERFEEVFALFPAETDRSAVADSVAGVFKSYLSNRDLARQVNEAREKRRRDLLASHPHFFSRFDAYSKHITAWGHCCSAFKEVRKKLRSENVEDSVIRACQSLVAHEHPEVESWANIFLNDEAKLVAELNTPVVQAFRDSFPSLVPPPYEQESYLYRRFARKASLREIGKDNGYLVQVLLMYNEVENLFPTKEERERYIYRIEGSPAKWHMGWLEICNDTKRPDFKTLREFIRNDLRDWIKCSRPISEPSIEHAIESWPLLDQGRMWQLVDDISDLRGVDGIGKFRGNEVGVLLKIPRFTSTSLFGAITSDAEEIEVAVCGNLSRLSRAINLDKQLDVRNGMSQFRPNRRFEAKRGAALFHSYLKEQALRLRIVNDKVYADIGATEMTQSAADPTVTREYKENIQASERVAVLHYLPGGDRLFSLMIFERTTSTPTGWKEVSFTEQVHRTDPAAGHVYNRGTKKHIVLNRQDSSLNYLIGRHESRRLSLARRASPERNAQLSEEFGPPRTQFGRTHYKNVAASLGAILRDHLVGYCLVAVTGTGITSRAIRHPVRNFFSYSPKVGPDGVLPTMLRKSGIRLLIASGTFGEVDVRRVVELGDSSQATWGIAYHRKEKDGKNLFLRYGRKDFLLCPEAGESREFPRNACWAALLAATDMTKKKAFEDCNAEAENAGEWKESRWDAFLSTNAASLKWRGKASC